MRRLRRRILGRGRGGGGRLGGWGHSALGSRFRRRTGRGGGSVVGLGRVWGLGGEGRADFVVQGFIDDVLVVL